MQFHTISTFTALEDTPSLPPQLSIPCKGLLIDLIVASHPERFVLHSTETTLNAKTLNFVSEDL